jgi:hypothetical protein
MPPSNIIRPESITKPITLALVFTFISDLLFTQTSELWSELGCWVLLPLIFKATNGKGSPYDSSVNRTQKTSLRALWAFAIGVGIFSAFKAEFGEIILFVSQPTPGQDLIKLTMRSRHWCLCFSRDN